MMHQAKPSINRLALLCVAGCALWPVVAAAKQPARPNMGMHYTVQFAADPRQPALVTTRLEGGNEIKQIVLDDLDTNYSHLQASGTLVQSGPRQWTWTPQAVTGTLTYRVQLNRPRTIRGYDSYHGGSWIFTRARDLFPQKKYVYRRPIRILSRVRFILPPGWQVASAMRALDATTFEARERFSGITAPYGWLMAGDLATWHMGHGGVDLTIVAPRVSDYPSDALRTLLALTMPEFAKIMSALPERILVVAGPDPLWRGGISGEDSLYLNQNLPLIAGDYTSTAVHELFHITQGFQKAGQRSDWIVEGLAEYYSLKILRQTRQISRRRFVKGIRKFDRQGQWHQNLLASTDFKVLYNTAPLVFFYMDELIRDVTARKKSLRHVVRRLGESREVSTPFFRKTLEQVAPQVDWQQFLSRHVEQGRRPPYEKYLKQYEE